MKIIKINRKEYPVYSGLIKYFPNALLKISHLSYIGNEQHNKGEPLHWAKEKSTDEPDALMRHLIDYAKGIEYDTDGQLHLVKVAWRSLALLERYLENEN